MPIGCIYESKKSKYLGSKILSLFFATCLYFFFSDFLYETDFEEVDKLLMQYKKKKPASSPFSCFPFMRSKKHKMRNNLRTGTVPTGTKLEITNLSADC